MIHKYITNTSVKLHIKGQMLFLYHFLLISFKVLYRFQLVSDEPEMEVSAQWMSF